MLLISLFDSNWKIYITWARLCMHRPQLPSQEKLPSHAPDVASCALA